MQCLNVSLRNIHELAAIVCSVQLRWYQAAAWHPFFRAHAHHESRRREPFLLDDTQRALARHAIRTRQAFLPYWYSLFFEALWAKSPRRGAPFLMPLGRVPRRRQHFRSRRPLPCRYLQAPSNIEPSIHHPSSPPPARSHRQS